MKNNFNLFAQFALPILTIGGQLITALKYPEYGLIINLLAQPFWLYSSYKAFKEAKQLGQLINSICFSIITLYGIINYWLIK